LNIEEALEEWNKAQALLRQVSSKISVSLLILGSACLAFLALLAELVVLRPEEIRDESIVWTGNEYPLILLLLYTLMRAAAVTEKASRVGPLVNSWKFEAEETEECSEHVWMDHERQYIVQYINQSEAGFHVRGVRLTAFNVQKMVYYLAAFSFAMYSRLL